MPPILVIDDDGPSRAARNALQRDGAVVPTAPHAAGGANGSRYDAMIAEYTKESAIKKPNTVEQVAAVAVMLASDQARNITGCMFPVDGGTMPY